MNSTLEIYDFSEEKNISYEVGALKENMDKLSTGPK